MLLAIFYVIDLILFLHQYNNRSDKIKQMPGLPQKPEQGQIHFNCECRFRFKNIIKTIQHALANGEFLEIDSAKVVKAEDYVMPPMMKGAINVDGALFQSKLELEPEPQVEAVEDDANDESAEMERKFTLNEEF